MSDKKVKSKTSARKRPVARKKAAPAKKTAENKSSSKAVSKTKTAKTAPKPASKKSGKQAVTKSKTSARAKYPKRFLEEIKKELLHMRERLVKGVARSIQQETDHLKFDVGDFYDKASDDRERILSLIFSERERKQLSQIEQALKRIKEGNYGVCEMTGEKIGEDRLRVMPFARFTLEAQEEIEKAG